MLGHHVWLRIYCDWQAKNKYVCEPTEEAITKVLGSQDPVELEAVDLRRLVEDAARRTPRFAIQRLADVGEPLHLALLLQLDRIIHIFNPVLGLPHPISNVDHFPLAGEVAETRQASVRMGSPWEGPGRHLQLAPHLQCLLLPLGLLNKGTTIMQTTSLDVSGTMRTRPLSNI